jgi:GntP family gluconate:H+ symporter
MPDLPLVIWMILVTLLLGLLAGKDAAGLIGDFNRGYGALIGDFALILIPSFVLAAAIEQRRIAVSSAVSVGVAPFAAAGMV